MPAQHKSCSFSVSRQAIGTFIQSDAQTIVTTCESIEPPNRIISFWDASTGQRFGSYECVTNEVVPVFHPTKKILIVAGRQ